MQLVSPTTPLGRYGRYTAQVKSYDKQEEQCAFFTRMSSPISLPALHLQPMKPTLSILILMEEVHTPCYV
jgi:hypothetical protein